MQVFRTYPFSGLMAALLLGFFVRPDVAIVIVKTLVIRREHSD